MVDLVQPMPYTALQTLVYPANPPGRRNYWKAENMGGLSDEAINALVEGAAAMHTPFSVILLEPKGRAIGRVGEDEMAIGGRTRPTSSTPLPCGRIHRRPTPTFAARAGLWKR